MFSCQFLALPCSGTDGGCVCVVEPGAYLWVLISQQQGWASVSSQGGDTEEVPSSPVLAGPAPKQQQQEEKAAAGAPSAPCPAPDAQVGS